jgi:hypothetical protein
MLAGAQGFTDEEGEAISDSDQKVIGVNPVSSPMTPANTLRSGGKGPESGQTGTPSNTPK